MKKSSISDQKRLVRGEHWLATRSALRERDKVHHRPWKVLIVAGPAPNEEIDCIRALMPQSLIAAVDIDPKNVEAAKLAGADIAMLCDLGNFQTIKKNYSKLELPPKLIADLASEKFDAICLDLTSPAGDWLAKLVQVYWSVIEGKGVLSVTFSYGRDVIEACMPYWERACAADERDSLGWRARLLKDAEIPETVAARVFYALRSRTEFVRSILQYQGKVMPMISALLVKRNDDRLPKFEKILPDDFELAVTAEDIGAIYACPKERILSLRRSIAAKKAARTKKIKMEKQISMDLEKRLDIHA